MTNQEAIEILKDLWRWEHPNWLEKDIRKALDKGIEALENQKTGHWEETTLANGRKGMECSNCGCEPIEDTLYGYVYSDYCPNCGAKMEGNKE